MKLFVQNNTDSAVAAFLSKYFNCISVPENSLLDRPVSSHIDMQIFITHSLLRLARSARDIFEDVFDFLCGDCKKRNRAEQKIFYDFLIYLGVEYQEENREYLKGVLPPFMYTNKSGAWLKELELIEK